MVWNPWAIPGIIAVTVAVAASATVYLIGPDRVVNRRLAALLAMDAVDVFASFSLTEQITDNLAAVSAWGTVHFVADLFVMAAYLAFIGVALDTPLTRPFRGRKAPWILAGLAAVAASLIVAYPKAMVVAVVPTGFRPFPFGYVWGPWVWVLWSAMTVTFIFGMVAALHAWWRARRRGRGGQIVPYLVAFGIRDAGWAVVFGTLVYWGLGGTPSLHVAAFLAILFAGVLLLYVPVLAYGILRHQLLEIDLKIKVGIQRGTMTGIFVGSFVVAFAVAEQFVQQRYGWLVGGLAVGALLLVLRPLERAVDRIADRAMPKVQDTEEYRLVRKLEVYRATVEGAYVDGSLSDRERDMLARLQDQLGITGTEARTIEREIAQGQGVA